MKLLAAILIIPAVCFSAYSQPENWDIYLAGYDDGAGSTTLNMELINTAPKKELPYIVITGVTYTKCDEYGFAEPKELENLYEISDKVREAVTKVTKNEVAGTFMHQCERLEYIYVADTLMIRQRLDELYRKKYGAYKYYLNIKVDASWETYREFLYPNEETLEYMSNEKILEQLELAGDKLTQPRQIEHWLYFPTDKDRAVFSTYAKAEKFKIESSERVEETSLPYQLHLSRVDKIDAESINTLTLALRRKARECNGDYDGWNTVVIK